MGLILAIFGLSFLVFFHELGHFLFARLFGVKVLVFSVGFGKKLFTLNYKGTQYALSIIPLGGYVKLKGEDKNFKDSENSSDFQGVKDSKNSQLLDGIFGHKIESRDSKDDCENNSLASKHPLKRILIFLAGPLFNFIFAFVVYICIFANGVPSYSEKAVVGSVESDFLSHKILQKNDEILSINGVKIEKFSDIGPILNKDKNVNTAKLLVARSNNAKDSIKSKQNSIIELTVPLSMKDSKMLLGITPVVYIVKLSPLEILQKSTMMLYNNMLLIYKGIRDVMLGLIGIENLSGVIGIADVSAKAYSVGFINFILVIALISVNLGIINLLPIPIVDGGQILFVLYEWLTGRILNERLANALVILGISIIISLMLLGLYNDISRIMSI